MSVPSRLPYYLEADVTANQWDFYRSSSEIFADKKPSYLVKSDENYGLNFGIPARNKGKIVASASYVQNTYQYYQTTDFLQADTADRTDFDGFTTAVQFERSTQNLKQYANQGTYLSLGVRYVTGEENSVPGSTSVIRDPVTADHQWIQAKLKYDNYFKRKGRIRLGFYAEAAWSTQPFFANFTASILAAPSFEPIQETKTLFLPNFHAHVYGGVGSKNIVVITNNLDLRLEGYLFQPYRAINKNFDLKAEYGEKFARRFFIGSAGIVFHSPIGPAGLFLNYYDDRENPYSVLFHVGYIIFNKGALD
jgi:NTE family protein